MFARVRLNVVITTELKTRMWYTACIMKQRSNVLTVMPVVVRYKVRRFAKNRHITFFAALMALLASSVSCGHSEKNEDTPLTGGATFWYYSARKAAMAEQNITKKEHHNAKHARHKQATR